MKAAVVTGGAGDIGRAIGARLVKAGWRVGLLDLDREATAKAAAAIGGTAVAADVTDEPGVNAALQDFGDLDLLVANAGIGRFGPLAELPLADFKKVIDVNLVGAFVTMRAAAKRMIPRKSGAIVAITSINAVTAGPISGGYPAAKAGLAKLVEQMTQEWGPLGIRVNAVAPGFIDAGISTPFYADPMVRKLRGGAVPSRRLGVADDVAAAVAFLASDEASYINGHQLVVDGGVCVSLLSQLPREPKDVR